MAFFEVLSLYSEYIVAGVIFILAVVSFLVTLFTKRSVSSAIKNFEEVFYLKKKYLTADTRKKTVQSFSDEVPQYILDERSNELEVSPIPKNIQDYIDSHIDTALERALERFSVPNAIDDKDVYNDYTQSLNDLSCIADAIDVAEEYRDKFNLGSSMSISDIYAFVDKKANELKQIIVNKEEEKKLVKKEEIVKEGE